LRDVVKVEPPATQSISLMESGKELITEQVIR
jgi:hypothetical protein